jgi:peptidoglycan DL-endopeptidase CwlO
VSLTGCATTGSKKKAKDDLRSVLDQAVMLLGHTSLRVQGRSYRSDCSGFVHAIYESIGMHIDDPLIEGESGTHVLFKSLAKDGRITGRNVRPGDLLFFHNSWDRNGNKIRDDRFSHVGVAESMDADGTVTMVHFASGKVKRDFLNLKHPSTARDPDSGKTWNSYLRRGGGKVMTGQLFFKAGRPLPR